jgi:hypothetical protein
MGGITGRSPAKPARHRNVRARAPAADVAAVDWAERLQALLQRSNLCEGLTPRCIAPRGVLLGMPRRQVEIQHRRARGMGGTCLPDVHDLANLLIFCHGCHRWVEDDERGEAERRGLWFRHEYRDGVPVPAAQYPLILASGRRVLLHPTDPHYLPHPDPYDLTSLERPC